MQKAKPNATLTRDQVATIKRLLLDGVPRKHISRRFDIGYESVSRIARGEAWRDVFPAPLSGALAESQKLDAEIFAPDNLGAMAERILEVQAKRVVQEVHCPGCAAGMPLENGAHMTKYGVPVKCLKS